MLKYATTKINENFKIKVSGMYEGQKVNTLVGVAGLLKMVNDVELTNRLLDRAFATMEDKLLYLVQLNTIDGIIEKLN